MEQSIAFVDLLMAQRFYFDTSVFGGVFDTEFEAETLQLFEKVGLGEAICVYSDLTERELINAPRHVRDYFDSIDKAGLERIEVPQPAFELAQNYIYER